MLPWPFFSYTLNEPYVPTKCDRNFPLTYWSTTRIDGYGVAVVIKSEDSSVSVGDHLTGIFRE